MPIHLPSPERGLGEKPAHEQWYTFLLDLKTRGLKEGFSQFQQGTSAFIIVAWIPTEPVKYYRGMIAGEADWESLNSETQSELPQIYESLKGLLKKVEKLREEEGFPVGIAFWVHPEAHYQHLDSVLAMAFGNHFPGSPTR